MTDINKRPDYLGELRTELYKKREQGQQEQPRGAFHQKSYTISKDWKKQSFNNKQKKDFFLTTSVFKKFFIFSIVFFVGAMIFAGIMFYGGSNTVSTENVVINILGNTFTNGGEELALQIEVTNNNNIPLELSDLLVEYPRGSSGDIDKDLERTRIPLGIIKAKETAITNVKVILFGEQGSTKEIKTILEYRIEGSNAIFSKENRYVVSISSSPLALSIEAPDSVSSGQEFTFKVKVILDTQRVTPNVRFKIEYPAGFQFDSAIPEPVLGNNVWDLGDLNPGIEKIITVQGSIIGQDGEEKSFRIYSGAEDPKDPVVVGVIYNSLLHTIAIRRPFIEARILVDNIDQEEYFLDSQTEVNAEIEWFNNLPTRLDNVEIVAELSGNALDSNSIESPKGFYSSFDKKIIWDKNTVNSFLSIDPGEKGVVSFTFKSLSLLTNSQSLINNPEIVISVSIKGQQPSTGNTLEEINNSEHKVVKINSDFQIASRGLYFSGPLKNSGPIPPQAEKTTTYTIMWTITNSSNNILQARAEAVLPIYVNWLGFISPASEDIKYDKITRKIVWNIGSVNKGVGLTGNTKEVAFQIALLPSVTQIGSALQLLSETKLTGQDVFTGARLERQTNSVSTNLSSEPNFNYNDDKVVR